MTMAVQYLINEVDMDNTPFTGAAAKISNVNPRCIIYEMAKHGYHLDGDINRYASDTYYFEQHIVNGIPAWSIDLGVFDKEGNAVGTMNYVLFDEELMRSLNSELVNLEYGYHDYVAQNIEETQHDLLEDEKIAIQRYEEFKQKEYDYLLEHAPKEMTNQQLFFEKLADQLQNWSNKIREASREPIQGRSLLKRFVKQVAIWGKETVKYLTGQKSLFLTIDNKLDELADKFVEGASKLRASWKEYISLKDTMSDIPMKPPVYGFDPSKGSYAEIISVYGNMGYVNESGSISYFNEGSEKLFREYAARLLQDEDIDQIYKDNKNYAHIDFRSYKDDIQVVLCYKGEEKEVPLKDYEKKHLKNIIINKTPHGKVGYADIIEHAVINHFKADNQLQYNLYNGKVRLDNPRHLTVKSNNRFISTTHEAVEFDTTFSENTTIQLLDKFEKQMREADEYVVQYLRKDDYAFVTRVDDNNELSIFAVHKNNPNKKYEIILEDIEQKTLTSEIERECLSDYGMPLIDMVLEQNDDVEKEEETVNVIQNKSIRNISDVQPNIISNVKAGIVEVEFTNISQNLADKLSLKAPTEYPRENEQFLAKFDTDGKMTVYVHSNYMEKDLPLSLTDREQKLFLKVIDKECKETHYTSFEKYFEGVKESANRYKQLAKDNDRTL